jgi:hypothetical protein
VGAMRSRAERVSTRLDRAVACMRGSSRDLTRRCALWSEAAVHATLEGEAVPRRHAAKRHAPHGKKGTQAHAAWWGYMARGGLGGGEGDARTQVLARSAVRVPWRQALGHSIAASAAMVCCGA